MATFSFSEYAAEVPKAVSGFTLLPTGIYECSVIDCQLKENKSGTGSYWSCRYILDCAYADSKFKDRNVWDNQTFTLTGKPDSERIGRMMLADICFAAGLQDGFHMDDLPSLIIGKVLVLRLYHKKDNLSGEMVAKVGTYYTPEGQHRSGTACPLPKEKWITSLPGHADAKPGSGFDTKSFDKMPVDDDVPF